jgi:23S rRNA pseudouridine2605 synthase
MSFEEYRKRRPAKRVTQKKEAALPERRLSPDEAAARRSRIFSRPKQERKEPAAVPVRKSGTAAKLKRPVRGGPRGPARTSERPAFRSAPAEDKPRGARPTFNRGARTEESPRAERPSVDRSRPARETTRTSFNKSTPEETEAPVEKKSKKKEYTTPHPRDEVITPDVIESRLKKDMPRHVRVRYEEAVEKPKKKRSGKPRVWDPKRRKHKKPEPPKAPGTPERVQKLIAASGLASRRQAETWISEGRVQVNGQPIKLGDQATDKDKITVNGAPIPRPEKIYLMVHKPKGYVTTVKDIYGNKTVMDLVPTDERIYPVGRLDKDTTGLLLFTNDGEFANRLMHPRYEIQKTYIATLDKPFDSAHIAIAKKGIWLKEGEVIATIKVLASRRVSVTLHQGFNHVVKRLMKKMGYWVTDLERTQVGALTLNIPVGTFRPLTQEEVNSFSYAAS